MHCLTDNPNGLNPNINIINLLDEQLQYLHWNKICFFDPSLIGASEKDITIISDVDIKYLDCQPLIEYPQVKEEFVSIPRWWVGKQKGCPINGSFYKFYSHEYKKIYDNWIKNPKEIMNFYFDKKIVEYKNMGEQNFVHHFAKKKIKMVPAEWIARKYLGRDEDMENRYFRKTGKAMTVGDKYSEHIKMVCYSGYYNYIKYEETLLTS